MEARFGFGHVMVGAALRCLHGVGSWAREYSPFLLSPPLPRDCCVEVSVLTSLYY